MATVQHTEGTPQRAKGSDLILYPAPTWSCRPPGESESVRRAADAKGASK